MLLLNLLMSADILEEAVVVALKISSTGIFTGFVV